MRIIRTSLLFAVLGALGATSSFSEDVLLVFGSPRDVSRLERSTHDPRLSPDMGRSERTPAVVPKLDLVIEETTARTKRVTLATDGLRFEGRTATDQPYPIYQLAAPAEGTYEGDGSTRALRLDAEVLVTLNPDSEPKLYDVVLIGVPPGDDPESDDLEITIEAWERGTQSRGDKPQLRTTLIGVLE